MTSSGFHNTGEEWVIKHAFRQDEISRSGSIDALLYNDADDSLVDSSDIGDISTEPDTGNYARVSLNLDASDFELGTTSGNARVRAVASFDVTDTIGTVDAYALVANFESDIFNSETSANDHLIVSGTFDGGAQSLDGITTYDVQIDEIND